MLIAAAKYGFKIGEIPVPVRYYPEASSTNFFRSLKFKIWHRNLQIPIIPSNGYLPHPESINKKLKRIL